MLHSSDSKHCHSDTGGPGEMVSTGLCQHERLIFLSKDLVRVEGPSESWPLVRQEQVGPVQTSGWF